MATNRDLGIADATFTADADLTLKQYYAVTIASTAGNVKVATGASNPGPIGILQNSPSAGQEARVRVFGFSKAIVEAGACKIGWGKYLICASDGQFDSPATDNGSPTMARYLDATVSSGSAIGQVLIWGGLTACPFSAS